MLLDETIMKEFCVARTFKDEAGTGKNFGKINSFDFSPDGLKLLTCSEEDEIVVYDVEKGKNEKLINAQKYGCDLIHFTHAKNAAIHASTKRDDAIRYLSLHDNKFIRYFDGHKKKVTGLAMSPEDDTFISAALDNTLRLWDLRAPSNQGIMNVAGKPVCAFDPEGLVFSVGVENNLIKLYDLRSYDKGPFVTFKLPQERDCQWSGLRFSPHGKYILLSTNSNVMRLIDAFNGNPLQTFCGHSNTSNLPMQGCFSPNSEFVLSGSTDGRIHIWSAETGNKLVVLNGGHSGPVQCVEFNPTFMMMASACSHLNMWLPKLPNNMM